MMAHGGKSAKRGGVSGNSPVRCFGSSAKQCNPVRTLRKAGSVADSVVPGIIAGITVSLCLSACLPVCLCLCLLSLSLPATLERAHVADQPQTQDPDPLRSMRSRDYDSVTSYATL
eukprot:2227886-Rhodomonas_salina.1